MNDLETLLNSLGVQIVAFKTDSVFYIDPEGTIQPIVEKYFNSLELGCSSFKYKKFIHGQSRKSSKDTSSYFGLKEDDSIETNDIGGKINRHLLVPIIDNYFKTGIVDSSLLYLEVYKEMSYLIEEYNSASQNKRELLTSIVKRFKAERVDKEAE